MSKLPATLFLLGLLAVDTYAQDERNLVQFGLMIVHFTGREPLAFNGYGCWCGVGGSGAPVDRLDRCCRTHDHCYDAVLRMGCENPKFNYYNWTHRGCNTNHFVFPNDPCEQATCMCDWHASRCFGRSPYNHRFAPGWSHDSC